MVPAIRPREATLVLQTRTSDTAPPLDSHEEVERTSIQRELARAVPKTPEARAMVALADAIHAELDVTTDSIVKIGNRQRILTEQIAHLSQRAIPAIRELVDEGRSQVLAGKAEGAGRLQAALLLSQIQRFQVAYLAMANAADDAGYPSSRTTEILGSVDRALAPLVEAALTFDPKRIQDAIAQHEQTLLDLGDGLSRWQTALESGSELSRHGIAMADAALIVLSIYQAGRAIAGISTRPGIHGIAGNGAATAGATIATDELLQAVRKLIELGALDAGVVAKGPNIVGPLPPPDPILRPTPSGTVVPTRGPFAGREVRYEDPRDKHTKVANKTLEEMQRAIAKPNKAKGRLAELAKAVKDEDGRYGSQLSKEATDRYEKLVRDAVENGRYEVGKFFHTADDFIGIDVTKGRATKHYRVDVSATGHGAHVIPIVPEGS